MPYKDLEKNKEAKRKSAKKHFAKTQARLAALYRANKGKIKARSQQWRTKNHERMLATLRKYRHSNLPYTMWLAARHRAKRGNFPFALKPEDIIIPDVCPVLGIKLAPGNGGWSDGSPSLDKIKPTLGYIKENICVISWRANKLKRDGTAEEFESIAAYIRGKL